MGLRVHLQQTPRRGPVTGCTLKLTTKGKGKNPDDGEHKAAFEFYEVAGNGDKASKDRKIGTLEGTLVIEGGKPSFKTFNTIAYESLVQHTDFYLDLAFPKAWQIQTVDQLKLPWEIADEGTKFEVGVKLLINDAVHADVKANKSIDLPFVHKKATEDGDYTYDKSGNKRLKTKKEKKLLTGYGVEAIYPAGNAMLKGKTRIPIGTKTLNIYLHESVGAATDEYSASLMRRKLVEIFQSGGFTKVSVAEKDSAAARTLWKKKGGRWVAKGMKTDPDTYIQQGSTDDKEGNDLPFFDFWVFRERSVTPIWNEAGEAEILNTLEPLNAKAGTKRILLPTVIVGSVFDSLRTDDTDNAHNLLADTIAHEIGHALGLHHSLFWDGTHYSKHPRGLGVMSQMTVDGGEIPLKRFSPIERAEVEKRFL